MLAAIQPFFVYLLFAVLAAALLADDARATRLAFLLLANWLANWVGVQITGDALPKGAMIAIDFVTAWAALGYPNIHGIATRPVGRVEPVLAVTYFMQISISLVAWVFDSRAADVKLWPVLAALAVLQLLLVGGVIGLELARRYRPWHWFRHPYAHVRVDRKGLAE